MAPLTSNLDPESSVQSYWVRRKYIVLDGLIRPVVESKPEAYNPFATYSHEQNPLKVPSLYLQLYELDVDDDSRVEAWTSQWGLMGLFQHQLIQVRSFERRGRHWDARIEWGHTSAAPLHYKRFNTILRSAQVGEESHPSVLVTVGDGGEITEEPLETYFGRYFPLVAQGQPFPRLERPEVWDHLCEPVVEFKRAVKNFRWTVDQVKARPDLRSAESSLAIDMERARIEFSINSQVQRVFRSVSLTQDRKFAAVWVFPSLIAALYFMLLQDVTDGRLLQCANRNCHKPFNPVRSDQLFCSRRCLNAVKQRRLRGTE